MTEIDCFSSNERPSTAKKFARFFICGFVRGAPSLAFGLIHRMNYFGRCEVQNASTDPT